MTVKRTPRWLSVITPKGRWEGTEVVLMICNETKACVHTWMDCKMEHVLDLPVPIHMEHYSEYIDMRDLIFTHSDDYILVEADCNGNSNDYWNRETTDEKANSES